MILDEIVASSQERADNLPNAYPKPGHTPMRLSDAIRNAANNPVIAELKFASPSKGLIRSGNGAFEIAKGLVLGGCCALSVLTEPTRVSGDTKTIPAIREAISVPILRKDFIVDIRQIDETKALGADAVLLITSILGDELEYFVDETKKRGIEPVVEVSSRQEARMVADTDAGLTLINNRNLMTFKTDISTTRRISPILQQAGRIVISASGIIWPCDIRSLRPFADGFLIGSSIMLSKDPRRKLEGFIYA
jgi:indole-3-glycerol phosphate synthase